MQFVDHRIDLANSLELAFERGLDGDCPGAFFGRLTERRWALVTALLGQGTLAVRELARRVGRDVKRVHEDVQVLAELGLVERNDAGGVLWPYADVHIDMHVHHHNVAA
jgi:predicted transcriptional regulator